jgi:type 2A phosphatase activator TIP41
MVFGHNYVSLEHIESGFEYHFNAREALELVDKNASSIEVGYADHWKSSKM